MGRSPGWKVARLRASRKRRRGLGRRGRRLFVKPKGASVSRVPSAADAKAAAPMRPARRKKRNNRPGADRAAARSLSGALTEPSSEKKPLKVVSAIAGFRGLYAAFYDSGVENPKRRGRIRARPHSLTRRRGA